MNDPATQPPARLNVHGELELTLEGVTYVLRPSREAIEKVESDTGRSLMELADAARSGRLKLEDIAIITAEFCRAWGREAANDGDANQLAARAFTPAGLADLLYEAGVVQLNARLAVVLSGAVSGGYDARGKARGAWAETLRKAAADPKKTPDVD